MRRLSRMTRRWTVPGGTPRASVTRSICDRPAPRTTRRRPDVPDLQGRRGDLVSEGRHATYAHGCTPLRDDFAAERTGGVWVVHQATADSVRSNVFPSPFRPPPRVRPPATARTEPRRSGCSCGPVASSDWAGNQQDLSLGIEDEAVAHRPRGDARSCQATAPGTTANSFSRTRSRSSSVSSIRRSCSSDAGSPYTSLRKRGRSAR
jgi:hypothetical protein